jgi:hypothetical protein
MSDLPPPTKSIRDHGTIVYLQSQREFGHLQRFEQGSLTVTVMSRANVPASSVSPDTERDFYALAEQWRSETAFISIAKEQADNFAYHQIIGMGKEVLPLIFRELEATTSDWFWALRAITRADVKIAARHLGDVDKVAEAWLEWGRSHGYVAG